MKGGEAGPRGRILSNPFLWAFFAGAVLLALLRPLLRFESPPPPPLWSLPSFTLVDQDGRPFGSDDLGGKVYVANFFFTRCPSICPAVMESMSRLAERFEAAGMGGVRLVSISVDPNSDTPERLREYGARYGRNPSRWTLLTGEAGAVRKLLLEGFRVPMGEPAEIGEGLYDIAHTGKLVLVDAEGRVRGFYDATPGGVEEVFHRARQLLPERGG